MHYLYQAENIHYLDCSMIKDKLDWSISLRLEGLTSSEIKEKMKENNFSDSQIEYYLKKSDEIFLSESIRYRSRKSKKRSKRGIKMFTLVACLGLLALVFYGYYGIGLLGLLFLWTLIRYSSFDRN